MQKFAEKNNKIAKELAEQRVVQDVVSKQAKGEKLQPAEQKMFDDKFNHWKKQFPKGTNKEFEVFISKQTNRQAELYKARELALKEELAKLEKLGRDTDAYYMADKKLQAMERENVRLSQEHMKANEEFRAKQEEILRQREAELIRAKDKKTRELLEQEAKKIREEQSRITNERKIEEARAKQEAADRIKAEADKKKIRMAYEKAKNLTLKVLEEISKASNLTLAVDSIRERFFTPGPTAAVDSNSSSETGGSDNVPTSDDTSSESDSVGPNDSPRATTVPTKDDCSASKRKWDEKNNSCLESCVEGLGLVFKSETKICECGLDGSNKNKMEWNSKLNRCELSCTGPNVWDIKSMLCVAPTAEAIKQTPQQNCEERANTIWKDENCVCKENFEMRQEACEPVETAKKEKEGSDDDDFFNQRMFGPQIPGPRFNPIRLPPSPMHWSPGFT
jgi:hypothetical protein